MNTETYFSGTIFGAILGWNLQGHRRILLLSPENANRSCWYGRLSENKCIRTSICRETPTSNGLHSWRGLHTG